MESDTTIDAATEEKLSKIVLVNQVIVGALIAGAVFLTIMFVVMQQSEVIDQEKNGDSLPMIALVAAGVAAMSVVGRIVIGMAMSAKSEIGSASGPGIGADIEDPLIRKVAANWTTGNLVRNSMTDGAALFNGLAYMIEGQIWSIAIVGALIAWMVVGMPTKSSLKQRIEERRMDEPAEPGL